MIHKVNQRPVATLILCLLDHRSTVVDAVLLVQEVAAPEPGKLAAGLINRVRPFCRIAIWLPTMLPGDCPKARDIPQEIQRFASCRSVCGDD